MTISRITSPDAPEPVAGMWSNCLVVDGIAYLSGLTARNADLVTIDGEDEYEQTKIILNKHKALVEAAGGRMSDFTKLTIYVTRIEHRKAVWRARAEFFEGDFPACSLVEVKNLADPKIYVEIEGIAHIGKGRR
jgi:enamine deaminase RidA (YjgF/YER057c/UK114 family)